jgi:hypothetical protein
MTQPVHFVVGTGRCGSSLAHEMMCRHESVDFVSNLQDRFGLAKTQQLNNRIFRSLPPSASMKGRLRFAPSQAYEALERDIGPFIVDPYRDLVEADATGAVAARMQQFFAANGSDDRPLIHKFTGWPRARFLQAIFSDAKFVHVVRDPRAVVSSWLRMSWWRGHLGPEGWHFGPLDESQTEIWKSSGESFAVLGALGWQIVIDAVSECRAALGDAWLDIRYEDLCAKPNETLTTAMEHLGLDATPDWLQQLTRYELTSPRTGPGSWPELGDDLPLIESVCADGMATFEYARSSQL